MADFRPLKELLGDLEVRVLPPNTIPLEAGLVIKALDEDGDVEWISRFTDGPHTVEWVGAFEVVAAQLKRQLMELFAPDEDDDGPDG